MYIDFYLNLFWTFIIISLTLSFLQQNLGTKFDND